ncbi:MAG: hypothetical protein HDT28_01120 [Clostridiales bacterium]|nr:hypothetical protein [Clostridiales bacterium]
MEHLFDDILDEDEQIIRVIKPSKSRYWKSPIFPFAIPIFWPHFIFFMAITLFTLPFFFARNYKNSYYAYTNKRVIVRSGSMGVHYESRYYDQIAEASVEIGILDKSKKTHTGTLEFKNPPRRTLRFSYVENPYELFNEIKEYMSGESDQKTQEKDKPESNADKASHRSNYNKKLHS